MGSAVTAEAVAEDGDLPGALRRLSDAVSGLVDPCSEVVDGRLMWTESKYQQLVEEVPGRQGTGHGVARSIPPLSTEAVDLLNEIDTAVACWEPKRPIFDGDLTPEHPPTPDTVLRLQAIERRPWRPMDCRQLDQISGNLDAWVQQIDALLAPIRRWSLPNPCPACNTAVVYRKDSAGELVRQPALQIGAAGCECMRCHHIWAPEYFRLLASALGYPLPEGVLE